MPRVIITGGPGAGKTTLLQALQAQGHTIVGDSARTIIQERRRRGLSPRPDAHAFTQQVLHMEIEHFTLHAANPGFVFFDRSVVDTLCSLDGFSPLSEHELQTWLAQYPYHPKVFFLPAWREIYINDAERDHTFEHAEWVHRITLQWYQRCHYQLIEVPKVSVAERCSFVLQALAVGSG